METIGLQTSGTECILKDSNLVDNSLEFVIDILNNDENFSSSLILKKCLKFLKENSKDLVEKICSILKSQDSDNCQNLEVNPNIENLQYIYCGAALTMTIMEATSLYQVYKSYTNHLECFQDREGEAYIFYTSKLQNLEENLRNISSSLEELITHQTPRLQVLNLKYINVIYQNCLYLFESMVNYTEEKINKIANDKSSQGWNLLKNSMGSLVGLGLILKDGGSELSKNLTGLVTALQIGFGISNYINLQKLTTLGIRFNDVKRRLLGSSDNTKRVIQSLQNLISNKENNQELVSQIEMFGLLNGINQCRVNITDLENAFNMNA
jgi:hypothetical protein